jgi:hypothetical protein
MELVAPPRPNAPGGGAGTYIPAHVYLTSEDNYIIDHIDGYAKKDSIGKGLTGEHLKT